MMDIELKITIIIGHVIQMPQRRFRSNTNHAGSMQNLALINQMVLEDKTFDIFDGDYDEDDGRCCMDILIAHL